MTDYIVPLGDNKIQSVEPNYDSSIIFWRENKEMIRIDAQGFHYRGQFVEDAGEAHRLMVEFLRSLSTQSAVETR